MIDRRQKINIGTLNALYGGLLPEKRREILMLYYDMDISLSEIAAQFSMTRQGVRDAVIKAEEFLLRTEEKLGLLEKTKRIDKILTDTEPSDIKSLHNKIMSVLWE